MKAPIIGISADIRDTPGDSRASRQFCLRENYVTAITAAGGVPLIIPPHSDPHAIAQVIDGWLIPGGDDINAKEFGEPNHPNVSLADPLRFESESALYRAISPEMPVLGICYGCQFLNVVNGGTLVQHLPDITEVVHTGGQLQELALTFGSKLAEAMGSTEVSGMSYHHQSVARPGPQVKVVAAHEDGTVEGVEVIGRNWTVAAQWHPERSPDDLANQSLFKTFVAKAAAYHQRKELVTRP